MQTRPRFHFLFLFVLFLCGACVSQARALPVEPWIDDDLPFKISLPKGWQLRQEPGMEGEQYRIEPDGYDGSEESFRVYCFITDDDADDPETQLEISKGRLEAWISSLVDEDYEIYNKNDFRVDKNPTVALDFAKPVDQTYLVGRVVIVTHPTRTIGFIAMAGEEEWNANVRTFDKIISSFKIKQEKD